MPQVASESSAQALKSSFMPSARPSPSFDRTAASTPFDSLIDDSLPPPPAAQTRTDDTPPPADRPTSTADQPDRPPAADNRDASAADDAAETPANDDSAKSTDASGDAKDSKGTKVAKDTKDAKGGKDADKAAADASKSGTGDTTTVDAANAGAASAAAVKTPVAVAVAVTITTVADTAKPADTDGAIDAAGAQKAQLNLLAALQAETGGKADGKAAINGDTKSADKSEKKSDAKSADTAKTTTSAPATLDAAAKAQAAGEADTDKNVPAHVQAAVDAHRGDAPDAQTKTATDNTTVVAKPAGDIAQPLVPPLAAPSAPVAVAAAAAPSAPAQVSTDQKAVPLAGVGIEIASKALSGKNQFDIRLDPPDLGHIHIRLDVDKNGNVISHLVADRTDTLDMLRRDSAGLERALQDAGLKTSDNSMQFSLRDQSTGQQQSGNRGPNTAHIVLNDEQAPALTLQRDYSRSGTRAGGLDIRV